MPSYSFIWLQNVRERVEQMCGGTMILNSETGAGTEVSLLIPHRAQAKKESAHESSLYR